jgi:hypothetical protein
MNWLVWGRRFFLVFLLEVWELAAIGFAIMNERLILRSERLFWRKKKIV